MSAGYQVACHKCGKAIPDNEGICRVINTGTYSGGQNFYRNVNLCPSCDADQNSKERLATVKKGLLVIVTIAVLVGAITYIWFFR